MFTKNVQHELVLKTRNCKLLLPLSILLDKKTPTVAACLLYVMCFYIKPCKVGWTIRNIRAKISIIRFCIKMALSRRIVVIKFHFIWTYIYDAPP